VSPVRRGGLLSLGVGLAAAGAGAALGLAAERMAVGRPLLGRGGDARSGAPEGVPLGGLRADAQVVSADDGTALHVEVDEPLEPDPDGLTLVFSHGYCLSLDSWHFQREALRGRYRMVLWDQRGHGRSQRGPEDSADIDQCGRDLAAVIEATAPQGPLVLVGHSMGGMTVMSVAVHDREAFEARVVGVALIGTSSGGLSSVDFGLSRAGTAVQRLGPAALQLLSRRPGLVERGRRIGSDLEQVLVRKFSYASPVDEELVRFTAEMIASTRIEVVSDFFPAFVQHDKTEALAALHGIETLVLVGDSDLLTPAAHSEDIVRLVPNAEHVVVRDGGHLVMLEHPEIVTPHLVALVDRARRAGLHPGDQPDGRAAAGPARRTVGAAAGRRGRRLRRTGRAG
jgi:pimeloyl-ACP methyl ester carboxylesterase